MAVAARIKSYREKGYSVVVVVSAMGKTTDDLIKLADQITKNQAVVKWTCCWQP
jgi:aspartate kinase